jgi:hypothetical protein
MLADARLTGTRYEVSAGRCDSRTALAAKHSESSAAHAAIARDALPPAHFAFAPILPSSATRAWRDSTGSACVDVSSLQASIVLDPHVRLVGMAESLLFDGFEYDLPDVRVCPSESCLFWYIVGSGRLAFFENRFLRAPCELST